MDASYSVLGEIKKDIVARIAGAISKAKEKGEFPTELNPDIRIETPSRPDLGDFATGVAMAIGREIRTDGRSAAGVIVRHLDLENSPIRQVDIAGPGFLNFFLDKSWLQPAMARIWAEGPSYGRTGYGKGKKVLIEFVSANPTGPLNVVNARAAAVGDCLASLMQMSGYEVHREFYVNDAGNQVVRLAASLEARLRQVRGEDVEVPEGGYRGEYLLDMAKELNETQGEALLKMDPEELREFLGRYAVEHIVEEQRRVLLEYGLKYDTWFSEKSLRDGNAYMQVVELLRLKGLTYEGRGLVVQINNVRRRQGPCAQVRRKGNRYLHRADLAYHKNKFERGYELLIDLLGPDHHGYLGRLGRAHGPGLSGRSGDPDRPNGPAAEERRGRQDVKTGWEFITMEELLEEVGKDAARFFFLMRSPESHLDFDLDLARLQSNENPVFYVQYAHARIASIFRQAREEGAALSVGPNEVDFSLLKDPSEVALMKLLAAFPEEVHEIAEAREPNRLIRYMTDVASAFHSFYTKCRVIGDDKSLTEARLYLARLCQIVLANALRLAGISAPESM